MDWIWASVSAAYAVGAANAKRRPVAINTPTAAAATFVVIDLFVSVILISLLIELMKRRYISTAGVFCMMGTGCFRPTAVHINLLITEYPQVL
jgi:hypothetical protein